VRPIYAGWSIQPQDYNSTLSWFNATYGAPSQFLYGLAGTAYYGGGAPANATTDQIIESYLESTIDQISMWERLSAVASFWGIKLTAYEAGPGWNVGSTVNVGGFIVAQRVPPMRASVVRNVEAWAAVGGAEYNYFSLCGEPSRYGMWGALENFFNQSTPKFCAAVDTTGYPLTPGCNWTAV